METGKYIHQWSSTRALGWCFCSCKKAVQSTVIQTKMHGISFCILLLLCPLLTMESSCSTELLLAFFFYGQNCPFMAHIKKRMSLLFPAYRLCHCYSLPSKGKCNSLVSSRGRIWDSYPFICNFKNTLNNSLCGLKVSHWILFQNSVFIFTKHHWECPCFTICRNKVESELSVG